MSKVKLGRPYYREIPSLVQMSLWLMIELVMVAKIMVIVMVFDGNYGGCGDKNYDNHTANVLMKW